MSCKFAHLKETDFDIIIDLDKINYVRRAGSLTWIHFYGDRNPLSLHGETAQIFWEFLFGCSIPISAAAENKNAETHTS